MNEERMPREEPREPVLTPQEPPVEVVSEPSIFGWKLAAVAFVLLAGIALGYGWVQRDATQQLTTEREDLRASLTQAKAQTETLMARVNALSAAQAQEQAARVQQGAPQVAAESEMNGQFPPAPSAAPHRTHATVVRRRVPVDDPRSVKFQQQLGAQQNLLAENQKELDQNEKPDRPDPGQLGPGQNRPQFESANGADRTGRRYCSQSLRTGGLAEERRAQLL